MDKLPIDKYKEEIIEKADEHDVLIVCGDTGCGKSSRVVQFLLETKHALRPASTKKKMIMATQPRRIAALSLAKRVGQELAGKYDEKKEAEGKKEAKKEAAEEKRKGRTVGYAIGQERQFDENEADIVFVTCGWLVSKAVHCPSFVLDHLSYLVIDEAHERDIDMDLLVFVAKVLQKRSRGSLKIVIMSATLNAEVFLSYFCTTTTVAMVNINMRRFPVSVFFLNELDKWSVMQTKVGDFFMAMTKASCQTDPKGFIGAVDFLCTKVFLPSLCSSTCSVSNGSAATSSTSTSTVLVFCSGIRQIEEIYEKLTTNNKEGGGENAESTTKRLEVFVLHSLMEKNDQMQIFASTAVSATAVPTLKVILATNIAESSVTIPNVEYVIDLGEHKVSMYDEQDEMMKLQCVSLSQASAKQRAGRTGRVCPGTVIRLYSQNDYENFEEHDTPEVQLVPLENTLLRLYTLKRAGKKVLERGPQVLEELEDPIACLAQLVDPPDVGGVDSAHKRLLELGALQVVDDGVEGKKKAEEKEEEGSQETDREEAEAEKKGERLEKELEEMERQMEETENVACGGVVTDEEKEEREVLAKAIEKKREEIFGFYSDALGKGEEKKERGILLLEEESYDEEDDESFEMDEEEESEEEEEESSGSDGGGEGSDEEREGSGNHECVEITVFGEMLTKLPLSFELSKMVLFGAQFGRFAPHFAIIAAFIGVRDVFVMPNHTQKDRLKYQELVRTVTAGRRYFSLLDRSDLLGGIEIFKSFWHARDQKRQSEWMWSNGLNARRVKQFYEMALSIMCRLGELGFESAQLAFEAFVQRGSMERGRAEADQWLDPETFLAMEPESDVPLLTLILGWALQKNLIRSTQVYDFQEAQQTTQTSAEKETTELKNITFEPSAPASDSDFVLLLKKAIGSEIGCLDGSSVVKVGSSGVSLTFADAESSLHVLKQLIYKGSASITFSSSSLQQSAGGKKDKKGAVTAVQKVVVGKTVHGDLVGWKLAKNGAKVYDYPPKSPFHCMFSSTPQKGLGWCHSLLGNMSPLLAVTAGFIKNDSRHYASYRASLLHLIPPELALVFAAVLSSALSASPSQSTFKYTEISTADREEEEGEEDSWEDDYLEDSEEEESKRGEDRVEDVEPEAGSEKKADSKSVAVQIGPLFRTVITEAQKNTVMVLVEEFSARLGDLLRSWTTAPLTDPGRAETLCETLSFLLAFVDHQE